MFFRTHQEIVRLNPRLQVDPRIIFAKWAKVVYAQAAAVGVRRLAGQDAEQGDVNVIGLLEVLIRDPKRLWESFLQHYLHDAARARDILTKEGAFKPAGRFLRASGFRSKGNHFDGAKGCPLCQQESGARRSRCVG